MMSKIPMQTPKPVAILYKNDEEYFQMVHFNLVMENLNLKWEPYKAAEVLGVPSQREWDEIFRAVAKMHVQYWEDPKIKCPPFAPDESGTFNLSPLEQMMAGSPNTLHPKWMEALLTYSKPFQPDIEEMVKPFMDVFELWQGENGPKLLQITVKKMNTAPMTLCHGDVNPGNIWKGKKGTMLEGDYCFGDWQITRMAPAAWDFTTPQIGLEPQDPCNASLKKSMEAYYATLRELKPSITATYPYEQFEEHVKCGFICFWMFIMGYCYTAMIVPIDTQDKDKREFTWSNFVPNCIRRVGYVCKEFDMLGYTKQLLSEC